MSFNIFFKLQDKASFFLFFFTNMTFPTYKFILTAFPMCHCRSVCLDAVQLLRSHQRRLIKSALVFVTAHSHHVPAIKGETQLQITASATALFQSSVTMVWIHMCINTDFSKCASEHYNGIQMRRWQGRGDRLSLSDDAPFTPGE